MISVTRLLKGSPRFTREDDRRELRRDGSVTGPIVAWNATKNCNLEWAACTEAEDATPIANELTTAEARAMIEDLVALRVPELVISGGEPFARLDILDLAAHAMALGIRVRFSSNGTLITAEMAENLAGMGVSGVSIAIDGSKAAHDRSRGAGAYDAALRGIRNCRTARLPVAIDFLVTRESAGELDAIVRLVEDEGVALLSIQHLVYSGGKVHPESIELEPERKRVLLGRVFEQVERWRAEERGIEVVTSDNQADAPFIYYWLLDRDPVRADRALALMCRDEANGAGIGTIAIDSAGGVYPDQFTTTHSIGSIREQPLSRIWNDSRVPLLQWLRDRKPLLRGRCVTCQWLSVCNGNCRARAEAATGDYWQSDPACYLLDSEVISGAPE